MNDIIWDCETYPNIFTINAQHAWLPIEWSFEILDALAELAWDTPGIPSTECPF